MAAAALAATLGRLLEPRPTQEDACDTGRRWGRVDDRAVRATSYPLGTLLVMSSRTPDEQKGIASGPYLAFERSRRCDQAVHERAEDGMVEVLTELEADELLRLQVIEELRREQ